MPNMTMPWGGAKRNLPSPYDEDLSRVLLHVRGRSRRDRARKANSLDVASYLRAGMELLDQHLGRGGGCTCRTWHDRSRLLSFLSQRCVTEAMTHNPPAFSPSGEVKKGLRMFWEAHQDFVADLVNFALYAENYRPGYRDILADLAGKLADGPDFAQAVHEATYWYAAEGSGQATIRLSLALMASCGEDPDIAAAISRAYRNHLGLWSGMYAEVMSARKLRLRPGLTMADLTNAISAATDGVILRTVGDPQAGLLDRVNHKSLLGHITLAIINGFLEPEDEIDGLTLEQGVTARY